MFLLSKLAEVDDQFQDLYFELQGCVDKTHTTKKTYTWNKTGTKVMDLKRIDRNDKN